MNSTEMLGFRICWSAYDWSATRGAGRALDSLGDVGLGGRHIPTSISITMLSRREEKDARGDLLHLIERKECSSDRS